MEEEGSAGLVYEEGGVAMRIGMAAFVVVEGLLGAGDAEVWLTAGCIGTGDMAAAGLGAVLTPVFLVAIATFGEVCAAAVAFVFACAGGAGRIGTGAGEGRCNEGVKESEGGWRKVLPSKSLACSGSSAQSGG